MAADEEVGNSRRNFVKVATLTLGASALADARATPSSAQPETGGSRTPGRGTPGNSPDLIVIGAGTAGLPAAIQAADLGARVLVLEKNVAIGGMLHVSGAQMSAASTRMQIQKGFDDSPAKHYRDVLRIGRYKNDSELVRLDVENAAAMVDWLQDLGVEFTPDSPIIYYGHEVYSVPRTHNPLHAGRTVLEVFRREFQKRVDRGDITVRFEVRAKSLIRAADGRVVGAIAEDKAGATHEFRAAAVILATGGYGASQELREKYNPGYRHAIYGGLPHATGDGIVMAQALGAKLTQHMHNLIASPGVIDDPDDPGSTMSLGRVELTWDKFRGAVWVNTRAERFINEDGFGQDDKEKALIRQPDMTFFVLFDEKARLANPPIVSGWTREHFEQEAARGVIIRKADSIEALARRIGVDASKLQATIERYNGYVRDGTDPEFGRERMQYPLAEPPFYAIRTIGFFLLTMGGLKVNHRLEVEDENGKAIAGLYAVGEVQGNGQLAGDGLVGGMSVTPAITFGRLAARYALDHARATSALG